MVGVVPKYRSAPRLASILFLPRRCVSVTAIVQRLYCVKLSVAVLSGSLLPLALVVSRGPCNDKSEARTLLGRAAEKGRPRRLLADEEYNAEWVHEFCQEKWCVASYIPYAVRR